jgi:hypothetical protein
MIEDADKGVHRFEEVLLASRLVNGVEAGTEVPQWLEG